MADHKFPEGASKIVGPDGKTHYRLNAEPGSMGAHGTPLGKAVAPRPSTEQVPPRLRIMLDFGKGPESVAVYTPEEALNPEIKQYEKKRFLATCLLAQHRQVNTVPAPSGRGEVDALRAKVNELENRPRKRLWFVVTADGSEVHEATSKDDALKRYLQGHKGEARTDAAEEVHAVNEVTAADVTTLLELNEEGAAAKRLLENALPHLHLAQTEAADGLMREAAALVEQSVLAGAARRKASKS